MTKSQIKAELRKEALGAFPMFYRISTEAYIECSRYLPPYGGNNWDEDGENKRFFFLLVAESL